MNILYLGYWPADDPLTHAVIYPRLEMLVGEKKVDRLIFCSIERNKLSTPSFTHPKLKWIGFMSNKHFSVLLTKFSDFIRLIALLKKIISREKIDLAIANSPLAGGVMYLVSRFTKIPFLVECFEPHAFYMVSSGVWKPVDSRYWILRYLEERQKKHAWKLLTVADNYSKKLIDEGVPQSKILTLANGVSMREFAFNAEERTAIREKLHFDEDHTVGIYVGKFGGLYYDQEAFKLFASAFEYFGEKFRLIILTADDKLLINSKLKLADINPKLVYVDSVLHDEVPGYLSASDFAFATIKPTPSAKYRCPVKTGEYWSNGLPVLMERGIGDDSGIIEIEGGGILFDQTKPEPGFAQLSKLLEQGRVPLLPSITAIAHKYRRMELTTRVFQRLLEEFNA